MVKGDYMEYSEAKSLVQTILQALPGSPFNQFITRVSNSQGLAWLNWFFPVSECLRVMAAWLVSVAVFYAIMVVLRWVKVIAG